MWPLSSVFRYIGAKVYTIWVHGPLGFNHAYLLVERMDALGFGQGELKTDNSAEAG